MTTDKSAPCSGVAAIAKAGKSAAQIGAMRRRQRSVRTAGLVPSIKHAHDSAHGTDRAFLQITTAQTKSAPARGAARSWSAAGFDGHKSGTSPGRRMGESPRVWAIVEASRPLLAEPSAKPTSYQTEKPAPTGRGQKCLMRLITEPEWAIDADRALLSPTSSNDINDRQSRDVFQDIRRESKRADKSCPHRAPTGITHQRHARRAGRGHRR
jgi:hypothetical protein